jgi:hypothetical protein
MDPIRTENQDTTLRMFECFCATKYTRLKHRGVLFRTGVGLCWASAAVGGAVAVQSQGVARALGSSVLALASTIALWIMLSGLWEQVCKSPQVYLEDLNSSLKPFRLEFRAIDDKLILNLNPDQTEEDD